MHNNKLDMRESDELEVLLYRDNNFNINDAKRQTTNCIIIIYHSLVVNKR